MDEEVQAGPNLLVWVGYVLIFSLDSVLPWWTMKGGSCEGNPSAPINPISFAISASQQGRFPCGQQTSET